MADDPLITEINVLAEAQQKMVNEQEKEAGAAEQDRSERMETLKKQLANSEHNSKENQRIRKEIVMANKTAREQKSISTEISRSTASALGISGGDEEVALAVEALNEQTKAILGISAADLKANKELKVAIENDTKVLEAEGAEIKAAGADPEKNEEYQKRSAELQAKTNELAGRSLVGMEADKHKLEQIKIALEKSGGIATDNKKYNEMSLDLQQKELDLRRKTAETPAAKKAVKEEQKKINAERAGLMGRIARGMDFMKENAKEKMKAAGKGIMAILKGTLIAGFLVALIAFFNSKYWEQTKEWIVNKGLPMLKNLWGTLSEGFGKIADFFKDPTLDNFLNMLNPKSALVLAIGGIVASLAVAKFLGPFIKGIGLLKSAMGGIGGAAAKLIPGMGGKGGAASKVSSKVKGGSAGKAFGQVIGNIGKGLGRGIQGVLTGLAMGLKAFASPQVLIGAGILAGVILVIGAGIAGASWLLGKALPVLTDGIKSFENLNGEKLKTVAIGIGAIGLAMFALGAGGAVGGMGSMVGAITGSIGKFFGAKDPLTQLKKFSEAKINVEQAKKNANAMVAYAKAMAAGGGATAVQGLGAFVGGIAGSIGKFFGGKDAVDPLTQLKRFGETAVNAANIKANAAAMKDYASAMKDFPETPVKLGEFMNRSLGALAKAFGAKEGVGTPLDSLNNFGSKAVNAKNIKTNAAAMKDYSAAMKDFPATPVKLGDFINGMLDSLSSFLGITKKTESPLQKLENFGKLKVDAANIKTNAEAMTLYGNAMKTLPAPTGGWAAVGAFVGGVFSSLGKLVGLEKAKSPLEKLKEFGEFQIGAKALARIPETAQAMTLYGDAMAKVPKPSGGWEGIGAMVGGIAKSIGGWFSSEKESPLTQLKKFGEMAINTGGVKVNAAAFLEWSKAMGKGTPLLKKAFENFEIPSDASEALEQFGKLGAVGSGLESAGRGIGTLGENMKKFFESTKDFTKDQVKRVSQILRTFIRPFMSLRMTGGGGFIDQISNLLRTIGNMPAGSLDTFDASKFKFPVPNKSEIKNMHQFSIATNNTMKAMKLLGIEGPKALKAFDGGAAIPVRVVGDVRIAEMREMKLDSSGNQATSGVVVTNAPNNVVANKSSSINLNATPITDSKVKDLNAE
jgi:hypothetical protein